MPPLGGRGIKRVVNIKIAGDRVMEESMTNAIKYISEQLKDDPEYNKNNLVDEVSRKYDLSPLQTEFLINKYVMGL